MNEDTLAIARVPAHEPVRVNKPSKAGVRCLIVAVGAAVLTWPVAICTVLVAHPTVEMLIIAMLAACITTTTVAAALWIRQSLMAANARDRQAMMRVLTGQYTLAMAELRAQRRIMEETGGWSVRHLEALGVRFERIASGLYFTGYADGVTDLTGTDGPAQVIPINRAVGRARVRER